MLLISYQLKTILTRNIIITAIYKRYTIIKIHRSGANYIQGIERIFFYNYEGGSSWCVINLFIFQINILQWIVAHRLKVG